MKKSSVLFLGVFIFFLNWHITQAHLVGQPPYFKVNGVYSIFYPVQSYSINPEIVPPQDFASDIYVVNEPIAFELDKIQLATIIPLEIVEKTKFTWDFGDGTKGQGFINNHTYTKSGSHIVTIFADTTSFEKGVEPQLLQSVFFDVLPNKEYKVPSAVIKINGKEITKDPNTNTTENVFPIRTDTPVHFDASESTRGSSNIVNYIWDFGDGTTGSGVSVDHIYKSGFTFLAPTLKVTDANGFYSETSIGIKEGDDANIPNQITGQSSTKEKASSSLPKIGIGVVVILFIVGISIVLRRKRR